MQAVPDPLALLWVVDLQDGHRVDPRLLRLCRLSLRLFTGEFCHWVLSWAGTGGSRGLSVGHLAGSPIPSALGVSWQSVAASGSAGHPRGLAAVGILVSFDLRASGPSRAPG